VGRVASAQDAQVAAGWPGTGAERLLGRGDFIAVAEGKVYRFQAAYVPVTDLPNCVAEVAGGIPAGAGSGWKAELFAGAWAR
jgi:S-DNA-T family DNA segregation ATPase FtsK/SpoIIIE